MKIIKIEIEYEELDLHSEWYVLGQTDSGNMFSGTGLSIMAAMAEAGLSLQMIMEGADNGEV